MIISRAMFLIAFLILSISSAYACNCGCMGDNCGAANNLPAGIIPVAQSDYSKFICEAPKAITQNNEVKQPDTVKADSKCNGNCGSK